MRLYGNKFYIFVGDLKQLIRLLNYWNLTDSHLYKEFELLSFKGYHNSDIVIYDWHKGNVEIVRHHFIDHEVL